VGLGHEVLVGVWEDGFVRIAVVEMVMVFVGWRFGNWWRGFGQLGGARWYLLKDYDNFCVFLQCLKIFTHYIFKSLNFFNSNKRR
jgi:hypothetical protein